MTDQRNHETCKGMILKWIRVYTHHLKKSNVFKYPITLEGIIVTLIPVVILVSIVTIILVLVKKTSETFTFTVTTDVRKDPGLTIIKYLSQSPWSNARSIEDIQDHLGFKHHEREALEDCPGLPVELRGNISAQPHVHDFHTLEEIYPDMNGRVEPKACRSKEKVAIIIPFRDREQHLMVLIHNLIPFLQRQQRDITFVVINQAFDSRFNRAILFNIGFLEASRIHPFDCFIFHDVDLLPLDDRNLYSCGHYPRHMSVAIDKFRFRPIGPEAFGGVVSFTREQFLRINGASNLYFGWGGEDDDLWRRVHGNGMVVVRHPTTISTYSMIKHDRDVQNDVNPMRFKLLENSVERMYADGLNTLQYKRLHIQLTKLFLWVDVEVDENVIWKNAPSSLRNFLNRSLGR